MNAERLLTHFDRVADEPDAILRLRRFVLDLAVRGKLVEQDSADDPASDLLKRITLDKKERSVSARHRYSGLPELIDTSQLPFVVPSSWICTSLGDITISRDRERVPVSRAERQIRAKIYDYYGASGVIDKIDGYLFDKPLLLIGEDGANLINRSTPIAFIARGKYWVNNHAHVLDGVDEDFLRYLELFINAIDLKPFVTGTAQPKMNQTKMNSIPIALPPEAEQNRIVAKSNELMALCDGLERAQTQREDIRDRLTKVSYVQLSVSDADDVTFQSHARFAVDILAELTDRANQVKRARQTILDLAVRGKLVGEDPADEPASKLLKRVAAKKAQLMKEGKLLGPRSVVKINRQELPFNSPDHWGWVRLIEIATIRYGFAFKSSHFNSDKRGMPLIRIRDISRTDTEAYFEGDYDPVYIVRSGDYLVGMDGAFNLHCWNGKDGLLNQRVLRINGWRCGIDPEFVRLPLQMVLNHLHVATSLTTVKHLSAKQVNGIEIPVPPLAEQQRIAAKVNQLMNLCDRLEVGLGAVDIGRHRLLESLLRTELKPAASEIESAK